MLEEEPESKQNFANLGDSGSSIIDNDGVVRGIVFAQVKIKKLKIIIDPCSKIPDIATIAGRRDKNGNIDIDRLTTATFEERSFVIVEDIEMILQRSGIDGKVIFDF